MFMLKVFCMGKMKEDFYVKAEEEYLKRINKFLKIKLEEVHKFTSHDCNCRICFDEKGVTMNSKEFSDFLKKLLMDYKHICFYVGGWKGINEKEKENVDFIVSFSKMTFPYQLFRVILLEQIYRASTLIRGIHYHK